MQRQAQTMQSQQQQRRRHQQQQRHQSPTGATKQGANDAAAAAQSYYPANHPMHPEDSRLNVKWPKPRLVDSGQDALEQHLVPTSMATRPESQQQQQRQQQPAAGIGNFDHRQYIKEKVQGPAQQYHQQQQQYQQQYPHQKLPLSQASRFEPMKTVDQTRLTQPHQQPHQQQSQDLADQHLHRLFDEIYAIRGEAETVQFKYRKERDAWAYENATLQARLAELEDSLRDRVEAVAQLEAVFAEEVASLREENRDLHVRIREDQLLRDEEAQAAAAAGAGGADKQVDELMAELALLKDELAKLQSRYQQERQRWTARRRQLEQAIDEVAAGKDPKAVKRRLTMATKDGETVDHRHQQEQQQQQQQQQHQDEDLAQASMAYYSSANAVKKEKAILELELEDEKRRNRVLEIEVEVLRDQVMRASGKARGVDGSGDVGADDPGTFEKESLEAPEKRRNAAAGVGSGAAASGPSSDKAAATTIEERLQEKNTELNSQRAQLEQLRRDSEQAAEQLEEAQQRKAATQQKLTEAREQLKAASEERDAAKAENERLKEENERRREESKRMREELARSAELEEKEKAAKREEAEERGRLQDENRDLKDKLDRQRKDSDAELDRMRQEKRRLEEKLRNIRDKMQDGQKNYKHFHDEFEELAKLCD